MRILYTSERPPYPFFLGGAARMLLACMAAMPAVAFTAVLTCGRAILTVAG